MVELTPERAIEIQIAARRRHLDAARRMHQAAGDARRDRARHAAVAALGGALQARLRERAGQAARCSASCRAATTRRCARESARALVDIGFHGYAIGGLAVGEPQDVMLQGGRGRRAAASGRPAALSDGRRHAGRSDRGGGARHRHVRLRAADPQRPPRRGVHAASARSISTMRAIATIRARSTRKARIAAARDLFARLSAPSGAGQRDCSARCCCRRSISPITRS